jgi:uncharacterized protein (TIGR00661 family)
VKILYAIQGTGNGHICRAIEVIPYLQKMGSLDVLISGFQADIELPFEVKYRFKGLSFVFGKKGGLNILSTYLRNNIKRFYEELRQLPITDYDIIISDFEPISAWAAYLSQKPCVSLSNQCALLSDSIEKPQSDDLVGKFIINHFAPSSVNYGFSYEAKYPQIFTPIIRKEVRELEISSKNHITVYLPSYSSERIVRILSQIKTVNWYVFSKKINHEVDVDNVLVIPINNNNFIESMATGSGVLCAAGFGTTGEALFLGKKLMVIPQKHQYEQHCNAKLLKDMGVKVIKKLSRKFIVDIEEWVQNGNAIQVDYPDQTKVIVDTIISNEYDFKDPYLSYLTQEQFITSK